MIKDQELNSDFLPKNLPGLSIKRVSTNGLPNVAMKFVTPTAGGGSPVATPPAPMFACAGGGPVAAMAWI